ncbi:MAG: hypothetical protein LRY20_01530, partial [Acholeplasmataceae bacterium]|nr:hypothetical protein [Acholeplasmataceae bacterium]
PRQSRHALRLRPLRGPVPAVPQRSAREVQSLTQPPQAVRLRTEEDLQKANVVDASATVVGSVLGASTVTSYIESLSGVGAGARTGLASVFTGVLFLLSIFLSPLLSLITPSVTAAAMVIVGTMMATSIGKIEWSKWEISIASFMTYFSYDLIIFYF